MGFVERVQRKFAYFRHDLLRRHEETNTFINNAIITANQIGRPDIARELEKLRTMSANEYYEFLSGQEKYSSLTRLIDTVMFLMIDSIGTNYVVDIVKAKDQNDAVDMTDVFDAYRLLEVYHRGIENRKIPNPLLGERADRYDKIRVMEFHNCNFNIEVRFGFHGLKRRKIPLPGKGIFLLFNP